MRSIYEITGKKLKEEAAKQINLKQAFFKKCHLPIISAIKKHTGVKLTKKDLNNRIEFREHACKLKILGLDGLPKEVPEACFKSKYNRFVPRNKTKEEKEFHADFFKNDSVILYKDLMEKLGFKNYSHAGPLTVVCFSLGVAAKGKSTITMENRFFFYGYDEYKPVRGIKEITHSVYNKAYKDAEDE